MFSAKKVAIGAGSFVWSLFGGVVSGLITWFLLERKQEIEASVGTTFFVVSLLFFTIVFASWLSLWVVPRLIAYFDVVKTGRCRGLWGSKQLRKRIKNSYKKSDMTKIKVTRGYNLFGKKEGVFNELFFRTEHNISKKVKILLHYPCLKSHHIFDRSNANQSSVEDYVSDIFSVLAKFKEHSELAETDEKIEVRFFNGGYTNWRYYIFNENQGSHLMLFNHYNKKTPGAKSKMFEVHGGNGSLCDFMESEFDEIFESASVELVSNQKGRKELCHEDFCKHPSCTEIIKREYKRHFSTDEK